MKLYFGSPLRTAFFCLTFTECEIPTRKLFHTKVLDLHRLLCSVKNYEMFHQVKRLTVIRGNYHFHPMKNRGNRPETLRNRALKFFRGGKLLLVGVGYGIGGISSNVVLDDKLCNICSFHRYSIDSLVAKKGFVGQKMLRFNTDT